MRAGQSDFFFLNAPTKERAPAEWPSNCDVAPLVSTRCREGNKCKPLVVFLALRACSCPLAVLEKELAALARTIRTPSSSPLLAIFSLPSSSCSSIALLLSFFGSSLAAAASLSPVVLFSSSSCVSLVFSSSSPLGLLLVSSWHALLLPCCPFGVVRSQLVLLLSSWCVRVVFLPSSFCTLLSSLCPPLVFLLSCCCRAVYVAFRGATTTVILAG